MRIYVISVVLKIYLEESLGLLKRKYIKSCSWQRQDQRIEEKKVIVPLVLLLDVRSTVFPGNLPEGRSSMHPRLKEHCICT